MTTLKLSDTLSKATQAMLTGSNFNKVQSREDFFLELGHSSRTVLESLIDNLPGAITEIQTAHAAAKSEFKNDDALSPDEIDAAGEKLGQLTDELTAAKQDLLKAQNAVNKLDSSNTPLIFSDKKRGASPASSPSRFSPTALFSKVFRRAGSDGDLEKENTYNTPSPEKRKSR